LSLTDYFRKHVSSDSYEASAVCFAVTTFSHIYHCLGYLKQNLAH